MATDAIRSKRFRIDQNSQKLMIRRSYVNPLGVVGILTSFPERITLEIQGLGSSRLSQAERIPLGKMAVWGQFGEGVIAETIKADNSISQNLPIVLASIGVNLAAGDNSSILIENCFPGMTYEVYALQTPTVGNLVYEYLEQSVLAGDKHRKVDVSSALGGVLPVAGLQKLVVTYGGGAQCEYLPEELQFINAEANDIEMLSRRIQANGGFDVYNVTGSMSSEAIVLKFGAITAIEVYTDGALYEYVTIGEIDRNAR